MTEALIRYEKDGAVAYICLNRPHRHNALNPQMMRVLASIWTDFALDRNLRVAILHGAGPSFCSGMDLTDTHPGLGYRSKEVASEEEYAKARVLEALPGEKRRLNYVPPADLNKPIVAALHGRVAGGGLELALYCDVRIATDGATFAAPEVTRGIVPGSGAMYWLPRVIGVGRAMEWLITGETMNCAEARACGLVNRVAAGDTLLQMATECARKIAGNAPLAVQAVKETVYRSLNATVTEGMNISEHQARVLRMTEDYEEGFRAFKEKRDPVFRGR
jgi:enoyl-CoA hydratase/carnithine racemase